MTYNTPAPAIRDLTADELDIVSGGEKDLPYTGLSLLWCFTTPIIAVGEAVAKVAKSL